MARNFIIEVAITLSILITILLTSCTSKELDTVEDLYLDIPDSSFEAILVDQGIDTDGVINQKMLAKDAAQVDVLELSYSSDRVIGDLTGIEGFVNLKKLIATQHNIENIDLSSNTILDTLYLAGNYISSIDISLNTNLLLLDVRSNQLNSIVGLAKATRLKDLNLSFNDMQELIIQNESLETLLASHNLIHTIDTREAKSLKNILLTSNELVTIDLSSNTLLETLLISDNKIQNIDIELNTGLTHLYISSNSLTDLDVGNNQKLVDLKVDRNPNLNCIKTQGSQNIPNVSISENQELNTSCE